MIVRPATARDTTALHAIYAHHVEHGFGTFEETPPSRDEMAARREAVEALGLPYLVAEDDAGRVVGFAYAGLFRTRSAYRFTCEDSVYVAPDLQARGVGKALLAAVIGDCRAAGYKQLVAVIGDSLYGGSIGLHRALGFRPMGSLEKVGFKRGRWLDVVMMQLELAPAE
jgi:phosphinothricin acetyltransferase